MVRRGYWSVFMLLSAPPHSHRVLGVLCCAGYGALPRATTVLMQRVPTLAIHLNRTVNTEGFKFNKETHLAPVLVRTNPCRCFHLTLGLCC